MLKSVPLRRYAGQLSYFDPKTWSNEDAMRIGRLHCLRDGWSEAAVDYMLSGGYNTIHKVRKERGWGGCDPYLRGWCDVMCSRCRACRRRVCWCCGAVRIRSSSPVWWSG